LTYGIGAALVEYVSDVLGVGSKSIPALQGQRGARL
jgi:hypothetical protein